MIADVAPVAVAMTAVINLGFAIIAGIIGARCWLGTARAPGNALSMRAGVLVSWLAVAGAASILLLDQAAQLAETSMFAAWASAAILASSTYSGKATAAVIFLAASAAALTWRRAFVLPALVLLAAVTAVRSTMGHAGESGPLTLAVLIEWAHLAAMNLWVGCVIVSGWLVLPPLAAVSGDPAAATARSYAQQLSAWATAALAIIVLSGILNTDRVLEHYGDLFTTAYGNLLLAKIVLVLVALGLGGFNRVRGMPALKHDAERGLRSFILILKTESIVLIAVVLLAAVLTNVSAHG